MSSGGQESNSFIPRWSEEAATLGSFDQRVKLFVSSTKEERYLCGPRLPSTFDPERDTFRYVRDNLTDVQLNAADESGALMIVKTIRLSLSWSQVNSGSRSVVVGFLQRNYGETMRHWTSRFTLQYSKVGQALNAANSEISRDFLHENIRSILLAETSGLTSSKFSSVLATSGTTSAEGESIGNSWKCENLVEAFSTQWCDAALTARDAKARESEAAVKQLTILTCLDSPMPRLALKMQFPGMTRINRLMSTKMMTMNTTRKTLTGTLVLRQMTQNFLNSLMAV